MHLALILISLFITSAACPEEEVAMVRLPDGSEFTCEIADTDREHATGLSRHESLAPDRGMLFVYPFDSGLSFWMPPTMKFNLDILFLDSERRIIHIAADVPPCPDPDGWDCPSYGPGDKPGRYVVELAARTAGDHGLKVGDVLEFVFPPGYKPPETFRR
ncbi:MAG TPA: DUF192 domain-containing protein [Acidobacteriota bacterium]|nr:DUF192 domain-containing protein [Acidobacteriota bacterium]